MVAISDVQTYSREHVLRMLAVSNRQLQSWERQSFICCGDSFSFRDIIALRALRKLREKKVPSAKIGQALTSLRRKLVHVENPLSELKIHWDGRRLSVSIAGQTMEAVTGQLLLDFSASPHSEPAAFPPKPRLNLEAQAESWFQRGLHLEETGAPPRDAIAAYEKAVEINPSAAGALVNLGTLFFRESQLKKAENCYRKAIQADPSYPLAHFNLANLYDEQGQVEPARASYLTVIRLNPKYADAYFNLALLCEQSGDALQALRYWKTYLKLDATSSWADVARRQLDRLQQAALVVSRS